MKIRDLFIKPIDRPINGVIKADQRDAESIWQELDEYVVTKQLTEYFRRFFDAYLAAVDNPNDSVLAARMAVWVAGSFGSGKSHFIKILSYLLENIEAADLVTGKTRTAASFFDERKIKDPLLLADIQRATRGSVDVILFNIDAKADSKSDRDVILQVFIRVFNEMLGFSGDAPHVAEMERYLVEKGVYDVFQEEFHRVKGLTWRAERDAVDFHRDEVVQALSVALAMSAESAARWFDRARDDYKVNIEGFAKLVRGYLDSKSKDHRIVFLVDEIGQFIGDNTQLMLTLQTITEQLGTLCQGRAWVIVTSQEDIDAAIGDANKAKSQDFSKIQGRFHTRLSLASSNTDEVIGERLLSKTEAAHVALRNVYERQSDVINNQISFVGNTVTMRGYRDAAEFTAVYPFAPYQFLLLQKIFESIRRVGATGKHLSKGERSLLDAFQSAARQNAERGIDALVPIQDFYPSIESFLDTSVKRAIDQAAENPALEPFDIQLLKALFLIRHVAEVIKPTVDNLATLCLDQIDADKLALKRKLQQSLERLEAQRLVNRNGDQWFFLTNEERDVAREIGHVDVAAAEKIRLLNEIVFDEVFNGVTKVRHRDTKGDYEFNRLLDGSPYKTATHALTLEVITPLSDDYELTTESRCIMRSAEGHGRALIRMAEGSRLDVEIALYKQIEKYVDGPKAATATPSLKKILLERKDENRERRARLVSQIGELIIGGDFYAKGQKLAPKAASPTSALDEFINYLVTNTYMKLSLLKHRQPDPQAEIRAVLSADDLAQRCLALGGEEANPGAIQELREYLHLAATQNRVLLSDVVDRFTGHTYGWKPEWEIVLIVARLFMAGEIKLMLEGSDLDPKTAVDPLTKQSRFKQVSVLKRKVADASSLKRARDLYKELFAALARDTEDGLVADFRAQLGSWLTDLNSFAVLASQKHFPGKDVIDGLVARVGKQMAIRDSFEFIDALNKAKDDWLDAGEDMDSLRTFYKQQAPTWRKLLEALSEFEDNRDVLLKDTKAVGVLKELEALRANPVPYGQVHRIDALIATVYGVNDQIAQSEREIALQSIEIKLKEAMEALEQAHASADLCNRVLAPLQKLKLKVAALSSIPQIAYLQGQAGDHLDEAMDAIAAATAPAPAPKVKASDAAETALPSTTTVPTPAVPKPSQTIRAADLSPKTYLETEAEVNAYIATLRAKLLAVLDAGQRVRIQ